MTAGGIAELIPSMISNAVTAVANNSILILTHITAVNFKKAGVLDKSINILCLSTNRLSALNALIVLNPVNKFSQNYQKEIH